MRHLRLVLPALAFGASMAWTTQGLACDQDKAAAASSASGSAQMAAKCTPEMMAACKASGASAASMAACSARMKAKGASAAAIHCPGMLGAAMTASYDHCVGQADAATASSTDHCAGKAKAVTAAAAGAGTCAGHSTAAAAGTGQCTGHGMTGASARMSADCDACGDMALCEEELSAAGARTQVVPLRNGVMLVYTAQNPGKVNAVQLAMARRTERLHQLVAAGDKARLCAECKFMRGAMASGKLTREVVNIDGGALTLMTSNDPAMVAKIKATLDASKTARKI